jgi:hypothetical protein
MRLPSVNGVRRQITNQVLREIFEHWSAIEPGTSATRGELTLTHLYRTEPAHYAKLVAALLPRDLLIESTVGDMDDEQIDDVIARIKERLSYVRPTGGIATRQIASCVAEPRNGEEETTGGADRGWQADRIVRNERGWEGP